MSYLTEEQRKQICEDYKEGFTFVYIRDLSQPVKVYGDHTNTKRLSKTITIFIGMWMIDTWKQLNGFSGLSTIQYEFINKEND